MFSRVFVLRLFINYAYARESENKKKKQFSRVTSHDLHWENKTYQLKRSIMNVYSSILNVAKTIIVFSNMP